MLIIYSFTHCRLKMSVYHSLLYVAFLISFAQCQTTLTQAEIAKILQMIQNKPGTQTSPQANNVDTVQLIRKLMASGQAGNPAQQTSIQPQAPMNPQPTQNTQTNMLLPLAVVGGNQIGGGGGPNLNGYLTARALDFSDLTTNMMLFNGLNGQNKQPQQQPMQPQQQPMQPQQPTAMQPQRQQNNGGLFGSSPMGNYFTARAFDFPDMYTNMMLFNGVGGRQQQTNNQQNQAQSTFDPTLLYLTGF